MATKFYAGIGSRQTPNAVMNRMTEIASRLENIGFILRSGGARGADTAFERGVKNPMNKEIFTADDDLSDEAFYIAKQFHPRWKLCSTIAKKLHARNVYQILGKDLNSPVRFVVCWTPDGAEGETTISTGGTGTAIRIAHSREIKVMNLFHDRKYQFL